MMKKLLVTLILLMCLPAGALAEKLIISTTEWPPLTIVKDGNLTGVGTEIVQKVFKRMDIDPEFQIVPWQRAIAYVKDGSAHGIFAPKKTEERIGFLYFCSEPLYMEKLVIIARKGSNIKAAGLEDLKDKTFGMVRGYSYGAVFDNYPGLKKDTADNDRQLLIKLDRSRTDLAAGEEGNFRFLGKEFGGFESRFETVYILSEDPNYMSFSKTLGEKGKILAEKFSQIQRQLKKEGVIQKIESRYFQ